MKTKLFSFFLIFLMIAPLTMITYIVPRSHAQEVVPGLSADGESIAMNFFQIDPASFKFNGMGKNEKGLISNASLPYLPLSISGSDPYDLQVINKGAVQQMYNNTLTTVYQWEFWYKYTVTMYTLGTANIFSADNAPITKLLYHQGWGADPWGIGQEAKVDITFKNYNLTPYWRQYIEDWAWSGELSYNVDIHPEFAFPPNVTTGKTSWCYKDTYFGFLPTTLLSAQQGYAEDFGIRIAGTTVNPLSQTPSEPSLTDGRYPSQSFDAHYDGFTPDLEVSNHSIYAPPNNTVCNSISRTTNHAVVAPSGFDLSALSLLSQQRAITVQMGGIVMKPAFMVIGGSHHYTYCDAYTGLLHGMEILILGLGSPYKTPISYDVDVIRAWDVKNVYQTLSFKTGVRILTLYAWDPTKNVNQTLGGPQGKPNTNTGDDLLDDGVTGGVGAKAPLSFLEQYLWLIIVVVVAVALIYIVMKLRGGGGGKAEVKIQQIIQSPPLGTEQKPAEMK